MDAQEIQEHVHRGMDTCGRNNQAFTITEDKPSAVPQIEAPCQFLFGIDDGGFGMGGVYVWIVSEPYFLEEGCCDDSSSATSVITRSTRKYDDLEQERLMDNAYEWLSQATNGIIYGECMESCWDTGYLTDYDRESWKNLGREINDPYEGKTRDEVIEQIKAALIERGFKYEPKLDNDGEEE